MADVPLVTITNGIPTGGTGTVQTISNLTTAIGEVQTSPTSNTLLDRLKTLHTDLAALDAKTPALGQALAAASTPVVLTALQIAALTAPVLGAGSAHIGEVSLDAAALAALETITVASVTAPLAAGTNVIGAVKIDQTTPGTTNAVQVIAGTTGGFTPYSYIAAASGNQDSQVVKNAAGVIDGYDLFNTSAAVRYVKIYDKATAPTSADTPIKRFLLPAGGGVCRPAMIGCSAGISIRITTGVADNDTAAATAGDVLVNLDYK